MPQDQACHSASKVEAGTCQTLFVILNIDLIVKKVLLVLGLPPWKLTCCTDFASEIWHPLHVQGGHSVLFINQEPLRATPTTSVLSHSIYTQLHQPLEPEEVKQLAAYELVRLAPHQAAALNRP